MVYNFFKPGALSSPVRGADDIRALPFYLPLLWCSFRNSHQGAVGNAQAVKNATPFKKKKVWYCLPHHCKRTVLSYDRVIKRPSICERC